MTDTKQPAPVNSELLGSRIKQLQRELEDCYLERNIALAQLAELRMEAEMQVSALQGQMRQLDEVLIHEQGTHSERVAVLNATIAERETRIEALETRISALNRAIVEGESRISELNQSIIGLEGRIMADNNQIAERDIQIATLSREAAERDIRIATISQEVAERDTRLNSIHASSSWRLTAPVRYLKRRWPHVSSIIVDWVRALYLIIPLPTRLKIRLKGLIFALLSPFLRHTASYQAWMTFERQKASRGQSPDRFKKLFGEWVYAIYRAMPLPMTVKASIKGLIFALLSPLLSNTASYQAWIQFERARTREGQGSRRLRLILGEWVRALYLVAPLPMALKVRIKGLIFAVFSPLLRDTRSYQAWVEFERTKRQGTTRQFSAEQNVPLEIPAVAQCQSPSADGDRNSAATTITVPMLTSVASTDQEVFSPEPITEAMEIQSAPVDDSPYRAAYEQKFKTASIKETDSYVAFSESGIEIPPDSLKIIAFYLPQFHPIPLNDVAWGKGFTEWTNVSKAVPQYLGHYQPHLPGELGFYDLRVSDVRSRQVELAKLYGIYGFCFHYYWFSGTRLLEKPLDEFVSDSTLDFPFCLCWANENWTRRWDGQEHDVLIAQHHSPESDLAFIEEVAPILAHPRYIRVGGKPILIVYRPQLFPDPAATTARWREYCERTGLGGIHLVAAQTFGLTDPRPYGFDAAVEFPPHNTPALELTEQVTLLNPDYAGHIYDYRDLVARRLASYRREPYPVYRCVFPAWDNEARRPGSGHVFHNSDPKMYGRWLNGACLSSHLHSGKPDERLVFINAWNEWGEGAHLEPDRRFGYAYLDTTKKVLKRFPQSRRKRPRIAIVLHLFYSDLWPEIRSHLYNLPEVFDLFITVGKNFSTVVREEVWRDFPHSRFNVFENRGRDILPFFKLLAGDELMKYDLACKIHTKKSVHGNYGEMWRQELLDRLMASPDSIMQISELFEKDKKMAIVGADEHILQSTYYWGVGEDADSNRHHVQTLAQRMGFVDYPEHFYFVAGSMFWFRPKLLTQLSSVNLRDDDFEPEQGQKDGTMAHGFERFLGLYAQQQGWHLADSKGILYSGILNATKPHARDELGNKFLHPTYEGSPL